MENKYVGIMVIGIAIVFLFIVMSFNQALEDIVNENCTHGIQCPMYTTLKTQKVISYSLIGLLVIVGSFVALLFKEKNVEKKVLSLDEKKRIMEKLDSDEKRVVELINAKEGSMYQSDVMKELDVSKVKVTRILDRLEGRGLLERKRRGMTNIVILK
ncbi:MarR family transcriptional regulator [Candidatus Woesearchaeota archaeon]|nr:MarR family transcriptional regulator [Candidatus Woesearchaeota archaeon]